MSRSENKYKEECPLISVITIVYNGVSDIERTIKSVAAQTYKNIEYVVVDAASTDGTVEVLRKYNDDIDVWVSEKDRGISDAFNKGIKLSSGEYVICLNCGDVFFSDDVIQKVVPVICSNPHAIIYGNAVVNENIIDADHEKIFSKRFLSNPICHQAVFVPSSIYESILYDVRYRYSMDFDLWHRLLCVENLPFVKANITVSDYMVGGITSSAHNLEKVMYEHWLVKQIYLPSDNRLLELMIIAGKIITAKTKILLRSFLGNNLYDHLKKKINI